MIRKIAALLLLLPAASGLAQGIYPGDAVLVNGKAISYQRFHGFYIEYRNAQGIAVGARGDQLETLTRMRQEAMKLLIEQELVAQAAAEADFEAADEDVDAALTELSTAFDDEEAFDRKLELDGFTAESFREHIARMLAAKRYLDDIRMSTGTVSDAELEQFYRENEHRLTYPEQIRVRHILLTWKRLGTDDDKAIVREQMQPILERAQNGEDFAALAREFSEDEASAPSGGDTGFFVRGKMMEAFEDAAFALEPGELSGMVETAYGVHIILAEDRQAAYLLPLDDVRDQLRDYIRTQRAEQAVEERIDSLRAAADVDILVPIASRN